jgi:hypothetical protein
LPCQADGCRRSSGQHRWARVRTTRQIDEANAVGAFVALDAVGAGGVRKVVYASSINADMLPLGTVPAVRSHFPWDEDDSPVTSDWYSLSKLVNKETRAMIANRYRTSATGLHFPFARNTRGHAAFATAHALLVDTPPLPGILVAARTTYISVPTLALARLAPDLPHDRVQGRGAPVRLSAGEGTSRFAGSMHVGRRFSSPYRLGLPGRDVRKDPQT